MLFRVGKWDRWTSRFASAYARQVALAAAPRCENEKRNQNQNPPDHDLVLYDFEASPWCRLVREYATILDLTLTIKPCPRETLLFGEGSFGPNSRFRPEAMEWYRQQQQKTDKYTTTGETTEQDKNKNNNLTFPLLVDRTGKNKNSDGVVVVSESYNIVAHMWEHYGGSVLPGHHHRRPDQIANSPSRSFAARFLSLAGPSYLRPWPRCGLMRFPSKTHTASASASASASLVSAETTSSMLVLYQAEGCPESRLVREALCCLEIPYRSVPVAEGSSNSLPPLALSVEDAARGGGGGSSKETMIPILEVFRENETNEKQDNTTSAVQVHQHFVGAEHCLDYLRETYYYSNDVDDHSPEPSWFDPLPKDNLGRSDGANFSVVTAAFSAIRKGNKAFVPDRAME